MGKPPSPTAPVDGDKPPTASTSTAAVATAKDNSNNTAAQGGEGDNTSSDAPVATDQQSKINIIPELPDATANAFTQLVFYNFHTTCVEL